LNISLNLSYLTKKISYHLNFKKITLFLTYFYLEIFWVYKLDNCLHSFVKLGEYSPSHSGCKHTRDLFNQLPRKNWIFSTLFNFVRNVLAERFHIRINKKIELRTWSKFSTISFGSNSSHLVVCPACSKMFRANLKTVFSFSNTAY